MSRSDQGRGGGEGVGQKGRQQCGRAVWACAGEAGQCSRCMQELAMDVIAVRAARDYLSAALSTVRLRFGGMRAPFHVPPRLACFLGTVDLCPLPCSHAAMQPEPECRAVVAVAVAIAVAAAAAAGAPRPSSEGRVPRLRPSVPRTTPHVPCPSAAHARRLCWPSWPGCKPRERAGR